MALRKNKECILQKFVHIILLKMIPLKHNYILTKHWNWVKIQLCVELLAHIIYG